MNPADGIDKAPKLPFGASLSSLSANDRAKLSKTPEDYVAIENRLAVQREKPTPGPQLDSIFDQLRGRLPKA